jgi:hypothetical protein
MLAGLQKNSFPMFVKLMMRDYDLVDKKSIWFNLVASYSCMILPHDHLCNGWSAAQPCEEHRLT